MLFKIPTPTKRHIAEEYAHNVNTGIEEILELGAVTHNTAGFIALFVEGLKANTAMMKDYCEQPEQLTALGICPVDYRSTFERGSFISDIATTALQNLSAPQKLTP